jgi:hypothetical protein
LAQEIIHIQGLVIRPQPLEKRNGKDGEVSARQKNPRAEGSHLISLYLRIEILGKSERFGFQVGILVVEGHLR